MENRALVHATRLYCHRRRPQLHRFQFLFGSGTAQLVPSDVVKIDDHYRSIFAITKAPFLTNADRQAYLVCDLNMLRFMNKTTASAHSYTFYKQEMPAPVEKSFNVIFYCGHSALQVLVSLS